MHLFAELIRAFAMLGVGIAMVVVGAMVGSGLLLMGLGVLLGSFYFFWGFYSDLQTGGHDESLVLPGMIIGLIGAIIIAYTLITRINWES